jgi:hypothetical protein
MKTLLKNIHIERIVYFIDQNNSDLSFTQCACQLPPAANFPTYIRSDIR